MEEHKEEQKEQEVVVDIALLPKRIRGNHTENFKKTSVISNHYAVQLKPINRICIFAVRFTPKIPADNSKLRNQIFAAIEPQVRKQIDCPVFTGFNVYSIKEPLSEDSQQEYNWKDTTIVIKKVKTFDITTNPKLLLTFLNNGLRNIMNRLNFVEIGRSGKYFNPKDKSLIDNLFMYSGFKANFVMLEKGYFLRVDSVKKIVRNETVLQYIDQLYRIHKDKDRQQRRNVVKNELVDKIVMSNYGKTRYYKIKDINYEQIGNVKLEDGISLLSYYEQKYKITIKNLKQPLLVAENKKDDNSTLLIPELMLMTGIPDDFDEFRRKKISEQSIKNPNEKYNEIGKLMKELKTTQEVAALKDINITLRSSMVNANALIIQSPKLELGNKNYVDRGKEAFFNLFNKPIFASKHEIKLAVIFFKGTDMSSLLNTFESTSRNLQVSLKMKEFCIDARPSIKLIEEQMRRAVEREFNICLIILPNNLKTQYKQLKITALTGLEIVTQVATEATMRKKNLQSVATKILLQIIAKRGNILWVPKTLCKPEKMMQVGFDTAKVGGETLLSICATINSTFSSIYSATKVYKTNDSKFSQMVALLLLAVEAYFTRNSSAPKEILIFVNGTPGDQVCTYNEQFSLPLTSQLREIYTDNEIFTTMVMVSCKCSERFFSAEGNDQVRNVQAGTLISEDLVSLNYDFYIVSQQSNRGTAVPNNYKVVFSNSKMEEGVIQEVAFAQCFNYVNWTGSIKVPAILQYAKKCSTFNSEVMEKKFVPSSLQTRLYFV